MSSDQIQKMLAQKAIRDGMNGSSEDGFTMGGLSGMCGRIEAFLAQAANAPAPQCLEEDDEQNNAPASDRPETAEKREIHLNLILGVFEERKAAMAAADGKNPMLLGGEQKRTNKKDILLPTKEAEDMLFAEKMRDSHAVLSMFGALADTRGKTGELSGADARRRKRQIGKRSSRARDRDDDNDDAEDDDAQRVAEVDEETDSSDDEVVIMDAEDLSSSSDEGDDAAESAKTLLFGKRKPLIEEM